MVGGVILYARVVFGRWTAWSFASPVAAYNGLFLMGFLNFCLATGLALVIAAGWTAQRRDRPKLAIAGAAAGLVVVWFCHIGGALLCVMLIIAREVTSFTGQRSPFSPRVKYGGVYLQWPWSASPLSSSISPPIFPQQRPRLVGPGIRSCRAHTCPPRRTILWLTRSSRLSWSQYLSCRLWRAG